MGFAQLTLWQAYGEITHAPVCPSMELAMRHRTPSMLAILVISLTLLPSSSIQASRIAFTIQPIYVEQPHQFMRPGSSASYQATFVNLNYGSYDQQTFHFDTTPTTSQPGIQAVVTPSVSPLLYAGDTTTFTVTISVSPTTTLGQDLRQIRITAMDNMLVAQLPITTTIAEQTFLPVLPHPEYLRIIGDVRTNAEQVVKGSCGVWAMVTVQNVGSLPIKNGHVHGTYYDVIYPGGTFDQDITDVIFPGETRYLAIPVDLVPNGCDDFATNIHTSITEAEPALSAHQLTITSPSIEFGQEFCNNPSPYATFSYTATGILRNDTSAPLHDLHVSVHKKQVALDNLDPEATEAPNVQDLAPGASTSFSIHRQWSRLSGCSSSPSTYMPWTMTAWGSTTP